MRYLFRSTVALLLLIMIIGCDRRPVDRLTLNDDSAAVVQGGSVEINATANDTFDAYTNEHNMLVRVDPNPLWPATPAKGTVTVNATQNTITYTANTGAMGDDNFTYYAYATGQKDAANGTLEDFNTTSRAAGITIHITETENTRPEATAQEVELDCDVAAAPSVVITLSGSDADGDPLSYSIVTQPAYGTLSAVSGNLVTYTANAGENICGPDHTQDVFSFRTNDGIEDSAESNVTVMPINI